MVIFVTDKSKNVGQSSAMQILPLLPKAIYLIQDSILMKASPFIDPLNYAGN